MLRNIQGFSNLRLVSPRRCASADSPATRSGSRAIRCPTIPKSSIVQWMRFQGGNFIRLVGVAPQVKWNENFTRFRAVRDGVDMR